jgi:hypothetical protein
LEQRSVGVREGRYHVDGLRERVWAWPTDAGWHNSDQVPAADATAVLLKEPD